MDFQYTKKWHPQWDAPPGEGQKIMWIDCHGYQYAGVYSKHKWYTDDSMQIWLNNCPVFWCPRGDEA